MHRYHNIDYVLDLELNDGLQLIAKAQEEERNQRIWLQWAIQLPMMALGETAIPFEEYRDRVTGANIDFRPTADIMAELDEVEKQFEKGGADNGAGDI